jgi:hypothetical protein
MAACAACRQSILSRFLRFRADSVTALVAELAKQTRRMGRKVSLDLFSPCLASLVGQDYGRLKQHSDWVKPMTYRLAQGPAGLRLEIPALIAGVANRFGVDEAQIVEWSARHAPFGKDMLLETREQAVPISFIQAEIEAAVRTLAPVPVYFGLELVRQPGVIDVDPAHVVDMVKAGRAANAAGLVISLTDGGAPPQLPEGQRFRGRGAVEHAAGPEHAGSAAERYSRVLGARFRRYIGSPWRNRQPMRGPSAATAARWNLTASKTWDMPSSRGMRRPQPSPGSRAVSPTRTR